MAVTNMAVRRDRRFNTIWADQLILNGGMQPTIISKAGSSTTGPGLYVIEKSFVVTSGTFFTILHDNVTIVGCGGAVIRLGDNTTGFLINNQKNTLFDCITIEPLVGTTYSTFSTGIRVENGSRNTQVLHCNISGMLVGVSTEDSFGLLVRSCTIETIVPNASAGNVRNVFSDGSDTNTIDDCVLQAVTVDGTSFGGAGITGCFVMFAKEPSPGEIVGNNNTFTSCSSNLCDILFWCGSCNNCLFQDLRAKINAGTEFAGFVICSFVENFANIDNGCRNHIVERVMIDASDVVKPGFDGCILVHGDSSSYSNIHINCNTVDPLILTEDVFGAPLVPPIVFFGAGIHVAERSLERFFEPIIGGARLGAHAVNISNCSVRGTNLVSFSFDGATGVTADNVTLDVRQDAPMGNKGFLMIESAAGNVIKDCLVTHAHIGISLEGSASAPVNCNNIRNNVMNGSMIAGINISANCNTNRLLNNDITFEAGVGVIDNGTNTNDTGTWAAMCMMPM
jgi:hypothetical protein